MGHDMIFYLLVSVLVLLSVACVLTLNVALILACLAMASLLVAFYRLHYLVDAMIFRRTNLIQVIDSCELSGERSAAVREIQWKVLRNRSRILKTGPTERIERGKSTRASSQIRAASSGLSCRSRR